MRLKSLSAFAFFIVLTLLWCTSGFAAQDVPSVKLGRAISMHGVLNWPKMKMVDGEPRYDWPPFTSYDHALRPDDLQRIKQAGFDTIRLTVGLGIFLSANDLRKDQLDAILMKRVQAVLDAGLNVIVDFHPISQDPRYPQISFTRGPGEPLVEAFRALLMRTARNLSALPKDRVVLEILNEPASRARNKAEMDLWQRTQLSYYKSIREVAPDLTLMVTGCCTSSGLELTTIDPSIIPDRNVIYTFHLYTPHAFTHQAYKDSKSSLSASSLFTNVPFPLDDVQLANVKKRTHEAFEKAAENADPIEKMKGESRIQSLIDQLSHFSTPATLESRFQQTIDWAKKHNIPTSQLFLGEFGVMRTGTDPESRKIWLKTVVELAEKWNIPWAYWSFETPEHMGIIKSRNDHSFDPVIVEALGLNDAVLE